MLWSIRIVLICAFVFHIHSAIGLTLINRSARPPADRYQSKRDYVAADYASRTMRWKLGGRGMSESMLAG